MQISIDPVSLCGREVRYFFTKMHFLSVIKSINQPILSAISYATGFVSIQFPTMLHLELPWPGWLRTFNQQATNYYRFYPLILLVSNPPSLNGSFLSSSDCLNALSCECYSPNSQYQHGDRLSKILWCLSLEASNNILSIPVSELSMVCFICLFSTISRSMYVLSVLRPPESLDNYTAPLQAVLLESARSSRVPSLMMKTRTPCCYLGIRLTRYFESSIFTQDVALPANGNQAFIV